MAAAWAATPAQACTVGANSVTTTRDLSFGAIVSGPAGLVTVSPAGVRSATGGAVILGTSQFAQAASAEFAVCSATDATVTFSLPASAAMDRSGGGGTMSVTDFTSNPPSGAMSVTTLGQSTLAVGATLNVGSNQAAGSYSGTFAVTVNYP